MRRSRPLPGLLSAAYLSAMDVLAVFVEHPKKARPILAKLEPFAGGNLGRVLDCLTQAAPDLNDAPSTTDLELK